MRESSVQQRIRLVSAGLGYELWRNNVGACIDESGRAIRYGLANESKEMNRLIKSSDLVGIAPIIITPDMVGKRVGVFLAPECKHSDWKFNHLDERDVAQKTFHDIVRRAGGFAGFVRNEAELFNMIRIT